MRPDRLLATGVLYVVAATLGLGVGGGLRGLSPGETLAALGLIRDRPAVTQHPAPVVQPAPPPVDPTAETQAKPRPDTLGTGTLREPPYFHGPARLPPRESGDGTTSARQQETPRGTGHDAPVEAPATADGGVSEDSGDVDQGRRDDDAGPSRRAPDPSRPSGTESSPPPPEGRTESPEPTDDFESVTESPAGPTAESSAKPTAESSSRSWDEGPVLREFGTPTDA